MKPAELCTRAADLIEHAAQGTTQGPWNGYITDHAGEVFAGPRENGYLTGSVMSWSELDADAADDYVCPPSHADLYWACVMNPMVAQPLVAWLRYAAQVAHSNEGLACDYEPYVAQAIAFARAVLDMDYAEQTQSS